MGGERGSRLRPGSRSSDGEVAHQGNMAGPRVAVLGARAWASRLRPRRHDLPQIGNSMAVAVAIVHLFEKRGIPSEGVGSKKRSDMMADVIVEVGPLPLPLPLLPLAVMSALMLIAFRLCQRRR